MSLLWVGRWRTELISAIVVMGEERKLLVKPGLAKVDSPGSGVTKADAASPPPQSR